MAKTIITLSRQFGSGGRTIGKAIAKELGIAYYDKEIIEKVAEETGFDHKFIAEKGEDAPAAHPFAYSFIGRNIAGISAEDHLWRIQSRIIREIAEKGPCVIVGRCAEYLLKDRSDCFHAFIHASDGARAERIVKLYGETADSPQERLAEKDKKRSIYYAYYTGWTWGMAPNYHLALDSSAVGIAACCETIIKLSGN